MNSPIFSTDSDATPVTPTSSLQTILSIPLDPSTLSYKISDSILQHTLIHHRSQISMDAIQQAIAQCNTILLLKWKQKQNPVIFQLCRIALLVFALLSLLIAVGCFSLLYFFRSLWIQLFIILFPFPLFMLLVPLAALVYVCQTWRQHHGKEASIEAIEVYLKKENEQSFAKHRIVLQLNKQNLALEIQQEYTRVMDTLFPEIL